MYSDALADSLLQICNRERLSYEAAAQRIGCSSRYFGRIVRRRSSPTLNIFEKVCKGFQRTPNELLLVSDNLDELVFRKPMDVNEVGVLPESKLSFPVCPRCKQTLERKYQTYCDRCGQCLCWDDYYHANVILFPRTVEMT